MMNFLIIVLGPTGIGKTEISLFLASQFHSDIFSADARQFFKEMSIGTDKPDLAKQSGIVHHFIDNLSIQEEYNVWQFEKDAVKALSSYFENNNKAVMVGGSGLYIQAVCDGIDDLPDVDISVRDNLIKMQQEEGIEALQRKLLELDPAYYQELDIRNPARLVRALEVTITTGKPFSSYRKNKKKKRNFNLIKVGLEMDKEQHYAMINDRVDHMFSNGLLEEANDLYPLKGLNGLKTVGYQELFDHFDGKHDLNTAKELIKRNSRRYAKRQLTWFRKDNNINWFHPDKKEEILEFVTKGLSAYD